MPSPLASSGLDQLRIASPCAASFDAMAGDDRKRFCSECKLHVWNLAGLTRQEAEELVRNAEGRLCLRFARRADGTVLTRDCPVGLRQRARRAWVKAMALAGVLLAPLTGCARRQDAPAAPPPAAPQPWMGEVAVPEAVMGRVASPDPAHGR